MLNQFGTLIFSEKVEESEESFYSENQKTVDFNFN